MFWWKLKIIFYLELKIIKFLKLCIKFIKYFKSVVTFLVEFFYFFLSEVPIILLVLLNLFFFSILDDLFNIKFIDDLAEIVYRWSNPNNRIYVALLHWNIKPWGVWKSWICLNILERWTMCEDSYFCRDKFRNFLPLYLLRDWEIYTCIPQKLAGLSIVVSSFILISILTWWMSSIATSFCEIKKIIK